MPANELSFSTASGTQNPPITKEISMHTHDENQSLPTAEPEQLDTIVTDPARALKAQVKAPAAAQRGISITIQVPRS